MISSAQNQEKATLQIQRPKAGYLYINDQEIVRLGFTVIVGGITVEATLDDMGDDVEFYFDGTLISSDAVAPYSRFINQRSFGRRVLEVKDCNHTISDELAVFSINFPKQKPVATINEVMINPDDENYDSEWIELYNPGEEFSLKDFRISTANQQCVALLPDWTFAKESYLVIDFGMGTSDDDFSDGSATYYVDSANQDVLDDMQGEIGFYSETDSTQSIIDFMCYSDSSSYDPGVPYQHATTAGIWSEQDFFNPMNNRSVDSRFLGFSAGDSFGLDFFSNDSNNSFDWDVSGGSDAYHPSKGCANYDVFGIVSEELPQACTKNQKEWTVMVYMADCDLEADFWRQLKELERVGTDDHINIVFEIDGYSLGASNTREVYQDGTGAWRGRNTHQAFRGFLLKNNDTEFVDWQTSNGWLKYDGAHFVKAYNKAGDPLCVGEINTGDNAPLKDFINWAKQRAPADNYILILGGHGGGWKGLMVDQSNGNDYLTMDELETALQGTPRLSIVGFDLCMMANIEVAYQIRDWSLYMVASEEIDRGWDYEDIFSHLQANPEISASDFCTFIVDSYHQMQADWDCHTLSAIDLGRLSSLYGNVRLLSNHLKEGMEDWGDTQTESYKTHFLPADNCQMDVKASLYSAEHYYDRNYIDLYHFVELIGNNNGIYEDYKQPWQDILDAIEGSYDVVIHNQHGSKHPNSHGLSIYFPRNMTDAVRFTVCGGDVGTDRPFDYPWPSRVKTPADSYAIYAIDDTTKWGKVPYVGASPHPYPETPNFLWRDEGIHWDEFLHRFYKPCADAGEDISVEVECGQTATITLNGAGSSSADDDGVVHEYFWDFDLQTSTDAGDWEKDGEDETNDDNDASGVSVQHEFSPGIYVVTLTVWDDHHLKNVWSCQDFPNEHWQTDQDTVVITVIERPCDDIETPEVTIVEPEDGIEVFEQIIEVQGIATDDVGILGFGFNISWSDGSYEEFWDLDSPISYDFSLDLELHEGENTISVYAFDAAENVGFAEVTVYYTADEDTTAPVTVEVVGQPQSEGGYVVGPQTPIWLNATDDSSGVSYIYYSIWWDSDSDEEVDLQVVEDTVTGDTMQFEFLSFDLYYGLVELRFYAVDGVGNVEEIHSSFHFIEE